MPDALTVTEHSPSISRHAARVQRIRPLRRVNPMAIAHVTAEYGHHARVGGLAEAVAGLAEVQARMGHDVVVFLPMYGPLANTFRHLRRLDGPSSVRVGNRDEPVQYHCVGAAPHEPRLILVDSPLFRERDGVYGEDGGAYPDNHRRFAVFGRAAARGILTLMPNTTVVHAHDWHAALAPLELRTYRDDSRSAGPLVVFSVHNAGYQGWFSGTEASEIGLSPDRVPDAFVSGQLSFMKVGLTHSDQVVTVSPSHARELRTPLGGFGLDAEFRSLGERLQGISNGIDEHRWDPRSDPHIAANYSVSHLTGKATCKAALQQAYGLPVRPDVPLFVTVSRLVEQKGFDLILHSEAVRRLDAQFVFLGRGEPRYHDALSRLRAQMPGRAAVEFGFTDEREHQLLAGADALLMPSLYEPCGLSQLHALRYGALVVARRVGGLRDTVDDGRTGFVFDAFTRDAFDAALGEATTVYADTPAWTRMIRRAMVRRSGWDRAAHAYDTVYGASRSREVRLEPAT